MATHLYFQQFPQPIAQSNSKEKYSPFKIKYNIVKYDLSYFILNHSHLSQETKKKSMIIKKLSFACTKEICFQIITVLDCLNLIYNKWK